MSDELVNRLREAIRNRSCIGRPHIYEVDSTTVGKRHRANEIAETINEWHWGKFLYDNGLQVPEMYRLIPPDPIIVRPIWGILKPSAIDTWYILMQKIDGVHTSRLKGKEWLDAIDQYRAQFERLMELGVFPYDHDTIYDRKSHLLYICDFEYCHYATSSELRIMKDLVNSNTGTHWYM